MILLAAAACLWPLAAFARINVVALPGRDSVQLTIYNPADLTMIRENRVLTLRKGLNKLEFSWANTRIDPTSVEFRAVSHTDAVQVLDVRFPPRVTNTLEWNIQSEVAGEVACEIRYFTSGVHWRAGYTIEADQTEQTMALAGHVRVDNISGEDYDHAQVRLVVGTIRLVEEIKRLAEGAKHGKDDDNALSRESRMKFQNEVDLYDTMGGGAVGITPAAPPSKPRQIAKESISEYFLYTVEGRDTIPTGWTKQLPSFNAAPVKIESYFKYEFERWGSQVMRHYRFRNDKDNQLGKEPLPDGDVYAMRRAADDGTLAFVGRTRVRYIPIDEQVDLDLGNDNEVRVEPKCMNWEKQALHFDKNGNVDGFTIRETWEITLQNSKPIPVTVDIRRNFDGDWDLTSDTPFEKVDATKVKFVEKLAPAEQRVMAYILTTRHGANATR